MKRQPILFTGENVRAILADKKTQTRRVIVPQPYCISSDGWPYIDSPVKVVDEETQTVKTVYSDEKMNRFVKRAVCRYGSVGDQLVVHETWRFGAWRDDGRFAIDYKATPEVTRTPWVTIPDDEDGSEFRIYRDAILKELSQKNIRPDKNGIYRWEPGQAPLRWHSSMFMPNWAARILLENEEITCERLQDITAQDAIEEGITTTSFWRPKEVEGLPFEEKWWDDFHFWGHYPQLAYSHLWDSINSKKYSFSSNPLIWKIKFKRIKDEAQNVH